MSQGFISKWHAGLALGIFLVMGALVLPLRAETAQRAASPSDEFFIISSVNLGKDQLVLKRPTEVTVLMDATDKTVCVDEKGKLLQLKDLRAGDTVFVTYHSNADGERVATRIRMGYMTPEEVHRH